MLTKLKLILTDKYKPNIVVYVSLNYTTIIHETVRDNTTTLRGVTISTIK